MIANNSIVLITFVSSFGIGYLLTGLFRRFILAKKILDIPNARSSHQIPTPRGGGLAVVATSIFGLIGLKLVKAFESPLEYWAVLLAIPIAAIGWIDDLKNISAKIRFGVQIVVASVLVGLVTRSSPTLLIFSAAIEPDYFLILILILFTGWMINTYNFMDGIDGILGAQVISVLVGFLLLMLSRDLVSTDGSVYSCLILGATFGFLIWNWHPAKIFMGDVGSTSLGFWLSAIFLFEVGFGRMSFLAVCILNSAFLFDTTWTLVQRTWRTRKPPEAHRSHAYQKLVRHGLKHSTVSSFYAVFNLFVALPITWAFENGWISVPLAIAMILVPLVSVGYLTRAGTEEPLRFFKAN